jgi:hypothetical protein
MSLPGPLDGATTISSRLQADVAELVDAHGSGPCRGNPVEVRVLSSAPIERRWNHDPPKNGGLGRFGPLGAGGGARSA